jgi:pyridoxal phosphate enzyme (YggS family)
MNSSETAFRTVMHRVADAASQHGTAVRVLAVSKTKPAAAVRALASLGQRAFGENYVQEGLAKQAELADLALEWHAIGPLQSNKCREVAERFDWLQSLDRVKLVEPLARWRPAGRAPLDVLVQVNVDDEESKSGCAPDRIAPLAEAIARHPALKLRGLMAIPKPHADVSLRRAAFERMRSLYDALRREHADVDTLSMGMSDDFELAIACGATMVRIGSALFGARA